VIVQSHSSRLSALRFYRPWQEQAVSYRDLHYQALAEGSTRALKCAQEAPIELGLTLYRVSALLWKYISTTLMKLSLWPACPLAPKRVPSRLGHWLPKIKPQTLILRFFQMSACNLKPPGPALRLVENSAHSLSRSWLPRSLFCSEVEGAASALVSDATLSQLMPEPSCRRVRGGPAGRLPTLKRRH